VRKSDLDTIKALLENGAPVNNRVPDTLQTALHLAVENEHRSIVRLLLEHGADVKLTDRSENTPLNYAKSNRFKKFMKAWPEELSPTFSEIGGFGSDTDTLRNFKLD
jgi:ankyrin repeat protein